MGVLVEGVEGGFFPELGGIGKCKRTTERPHVLRGNHLDLGLNPWTKSSSPAPELQFFTTTPDLSFENALTHASNVLRCATVAAQKAGDQLDGTHKR